MKIFEATLARKEEDFFDINEIFTYEHKEKKIGGCFYALKCQECGEMVAENYIRYKQGKLLCIPCSGYGL